MENSRDPRAAGRQQQFLSVLDREEATARFHASLNLAALGSETVSLTEVLGRILAEDVLATVDVPGFDRSNVDGFAVRSSDLATASDSAPASLCLNSELITPGVTPEQAVTSGQATVIATGGMLPRGADAVVMVEHTEMAGEQVLVRRPVAPGAFVTYAGSDLALGEVVLYTGQPLGSRETGLLAAVGHQRVAVWRRPRVAILSTGDELIAPGEPYRPGAVYDSNAAILCAAVRESGCEPWPLGILPDVETTLEQALQQALEADAVVLSGGTSKGAGDVVHRVVARLTDPGVIVHGVALKPGKPLCLASHHGRPVVILPGFPTSAIFTFHEFVAPVLERLAGRPVQRQYRLDARLPMPLTSEQGRTDYRMVGLVRDQDDGLVAYPIPKGSGAVTAFSRADGFIAIPARNAGLAAGTVVSVQLLDRSIEPADLTAVGSHCVGLDYLLGCLRREGYSVRALHVGSTGGLAAARRGECDIAGIHLLDPASDEYNRPLLPEGTRLLPGYRRQQGIVFRADDQRFADHDLDAVLPMLRSDRLLMVNRNAGSGTRILLDRLLDGARPPGYTVQPGSHNAVAAAVAQSRADWGMAIESVAVAYGLGCIPVREEHYDFVVPRTRWDRPAVARLRVLLETDAIRETLHRLGLIVA